MENNLDKIAKDLYGKIQVRFPQIKIGDENAEVLSRKIDIPKARFFEFEYKVGDKSYGTIAITLDEDDGVIIQISQDIHANDLTTDKDFDDFIRSFRKFAKNRLLKFDVQNIGKSNLDKRDYNFQSKPKELPIMENRMHGTSRISYQNLGEARLIVKHSKPINPAIAAGRSMHIESIYVENADGERFKYPYKCLPCARALAEHVNHGGNPYDQIGKHITGLSEELIQLRKFKGYVNRQEQISEAMGSVTNRALDRIEEVKKEIGNLQKTSYYEQFAESFQSQDEQIIPEDIMNDWVDRLTIRTFNEDLKKVFPYLYKIMDESDLPVRELGVDDLLGEGSEHKQNWFPTLNAALESEGLIDQWPFGRSVSYGEHARVHTEDESGHPRFIAIYRNEEGLYERPIHYDEKSRPRKRKALNPEQQLESFLEDISSDSFLNDTPESNELNTILGAKLTGGDIGANTLKNFIKNPKVIDTIRGISFDDKEAEDKAIRGIIEHYYIAHDPSHLDEIPNLYIENPADVGGEKVPPEEPAPAPMPEQPTPMPAPAPAPAPGAIPPAPAPTPGAMPMAESAVKKAKLIKMKEKFKNAYKKGATIKTPFSESMTIGDAMKECGINPAECGYEDEEQSNNSNESGINQLLKNIAGFWNKQARNFTIGGERAKIKTVKSYKDGECPNAQDEDVQNVLKLIDRLDPSQPVHSQSDEQDHVLKLAGVKSILPLITMASTDANNESNLSVMNESLTHIKRNAGLL